MSPLFTVVQASPTDAWATVVDAELDREAPPRGAAALILFVAFITVSVIGLWRELDRSFVMPTLAVLLLHELGHAVAMRVVGHRDVTVFLLPWPGLRRMPTRSASTATQRAVVALAGPVPGVLLGAALFAQGPADSWAMRFAVMALLLNGVSLLPWAPFDGAVLLREALVPHHPRIASGIHLVGALSILALAVSTRDWFTGAIALALGFGAIAMAGPRCVAAAAAHDITESDRASRTVPSRLRPVLATRVLRELGRTGLNPPPPIAFAATLRQVWIFAAHVPLAPRRAIAVGTVYLGALALAAGILWQAHVRSSASAALPGPLLGTMLPGLSWGHRAGDFAIWCRGLDGRDVGDSQAGELACQLPSRQVTSRWCDGLEACGYVVELARFDVALAEIVARIGKPHVLEPRAAAWWTEAADGTELERIVLRDRDDTSSVLEIELLARLAPAARAP